MGYNPRICKIWDNAYRYMRNIKLTIAYDGTNYAGWQIQNSPQSSVYSPQKKTIQEILEKTLQKILQEEVKVIGSGRTDAGVHALSQVANFRTRSLLSLAVIQKALNSLLPKDISIKGISFVDNDFHACCRAKSKVYRYIIFNGSFPSVFLYRYSWHISFNLNNALMQQEAKSLVGSHDFKSFCASHTGAKTTVRIIKKVSFTTELCKPDIAKGKLLIIEVEADGFLYNMMRNIIGTLVEIGRGRFEKGSIKRILHLKDRAMAGPRAPAQGLFLAQVKY